MFGLGFFEILVILVVVLLVVGPEKLPELSRTMGRTMWQLRRAADEFRNEVSLSGLGFDEKEVKRELNELKSLVYEDPRTRDAGGAGRLQAVPNTPPAAAEDSEVAAAPGAGPAVNPIGDAAPVEVPTEPPPAPVSGGVSASTADSGEKPTAPRSDAPEGQ